MENTREELRVPATLIEPQLYWNIVLQHLHYLAGEDSPFPSYSGDGAQRSLIKMMTSFIIGVDFPVVVSDGRRVRHEIEEALLAIAPKCDATNLDILNQAIDWLEKSHF